ELVEEPEGISEALRVGEVRTEEHTFNAQLAHQCSQIILVERVDPNVAPQCVARMFAETSGHLLVHPVETVEESAHPGTAVLDHADSQARESLKETMSDERGERVENVTALLVE